MSKERFTIIDGGRAEQEKLFQRLLNEPEIFEEAEFDGLLDTFRSRLAFRDIEAVIAARVRKQVIDPLERNAILAVVQGDLDEASRLHNTIKRRNRLGLRVIS